ncbi:MAG TPA: hypothetical protein VLE51_01145 [Candidatus Saccharimonadales bacterium]|nr:hypothetical protein [Candidatus Saccharimonadales bacterium]
MRDHKKLIVGLSAFVILILSLHFIPFDSRSGYLDYGLANVCIGYSEPVNYSYRWITGGVNKWDDQLSHLTEAKFMSGNPTCAQPVHLRLYLL